MVLIKVAIYNCPDKFPYAINFLANCNYNRKRTFTNKTIISTETRKVKHFSLGYLCILNITHTIS